MYANPYGGGYSGDGSEFAGVFACVAVFTLLIVVLYLWLFYRIFKKAGYSGWMSLLNLIPYVGSIIVLFMLAFGDWPALRNRGAGPSYGGPGYPPAYPPTGGQPIPPAGPGYQPPAPPMAQAPSTPTYESPAPAPQVYEPPVPPAYEPPAPSPAPGDERPPAPPAPPA